jgi:hypothetical protein
LNRQRNIRPREADPFFFGRGREARSPLAELLLPREAVRELVVGVQDLQHVAAKCLKRPGLVRVLDHHCIERVMLMQGFEVRLNVAVVPVVDSELVVMGKRASQTPRSSLRDGHWIAIWDRVVTVAPVRAHQSAVGLKAFDVREMHLPTEALSPVAKVHDAHSIALVGWMRCFRADHQ